MTQSVEWLARLQRENFQLAIYFCVRNLNFFLVRNAVKQQRTLHFIDGRIMLRLAQTVEVELAHVFRTHALLRQGAQTAIEAGIHLLLHERLRNGELILCDQCLDNFVPRLAFKLAFLVACKMILQLLLEVFDAFVFAELFGEFVGQLRLNLLLDGLDFDIVGDGFAGETALAEIFWIADFEFELLAGLRSAQRFIEGRQRVLAANFDHDIVTGNGLLLGFGCFAFTLEFSAKGDLRPVAVGERTIFRDRLHGGTGIADALELGVYFSVGEVGVRLRDFHVLRSVDREGGQYFQDGLELERLSIFQLKFDYLGLRDRLQL